MQLAFQQVYDVAAGSHGTILAFICTGMAPVKVVWSLSYFTASVTATYNFTFKSTIVINIDLKKLAHHHKNKKEQLSTPSQCESA